VKARHVWVGLADGRLVGVWEGWDVVGALVGAMVGVEVVGREVVGVPVVGDEVVGVLVVGASVGAVVGELLGLDVGELVGAAVIGPALGEAVGVLLDGTSVGLGEGRLVTGAVVGTLVGCDEVGIEDGTPVGRRVLEQSNLHISLPVTASVEGLRNIQYWMVWKASTVPSLLEARYSLPVSKTHCVDRSPSAIGKVSCENFSPRVVSTHSRFHKGSIGSKVP